MSGFRVSVKSIFHVAGRGTVFQGDVEDGAVSVGDRVVVSSPGNRVTVRISGIERTETRELITAAAAGEDVALLVRDFDLASIADGIWRQEHEIVPLAIEISRPAGAVRWWEFWKR